MDNRRRTPRHRAFLGAHILFNDEASAIDCIVRDLSDTGVRLKVESPLGIPEMFDLVFDKAGERRRCRTVWRRAKEIGATFRE